MPARCVYFVSARVRHLQLLCSAEARFRICPPPAPRKTFPRRHGCDTACLQISSQLAYIAPGCRRWSLLFLSRASARALPHTFIHRLAYFLQLWLFSSRMRTDLITNKHEQHLSWSRTLTRVDATSEAALAATESTLKLVNQSNFCMPMSDFSTLARNNFNASAAQVIHHICKGQFLITKSKLC